MQIPNWMASNAAPAPDYDTLLAQAKMKMMGMSPGLGPRPPLPSPRSWADAGLMGAGQPQQDAASDRSRTIDDLPPALRRVFDRMPPDMQDRILSIWREKGGGFRGMERGGGQDATGPHYGNQAPGTTMPDTRMTTGDRVLATGPVGSGLSKGAALVGGLVNPFAGLAIEAGRRGYNVNQANQVRDMLGIEHPGYFGDMFGGVGKGDRSASLGTVDIGNGPTHVSWGGMYGDRTAYTPEEARRRQFSRDYGRNRDSGGGGRSTAGVGGGGWGSEEDRTSSPGGMGGY